MPNILFLALQCFECSTMQVKQKKKNNKWICVICNQKQSIRKVFAQSYKAKELRFFVQSFNMSRKAIDEEKQAIEDTEVDVEGDIKEEDVRGKKRSDWSEYLDSDSTNDGRRLSVLAEEDGEEDLKIVTEMPNDMFKRPKLNKYSSGSVSSSSVSERDGDKLLKPSFSRRSIIKKPSFRSDGVMMTKKDTEQRSLESERASKPASKWDAYLINDEGEQHQAPARFGGRRDGLKDDDDDVGEWDRAIMEISSEYQIVDDEVHPDFM